MAPVDCSIVVPWTDRPYAAEPLRGMLLALVDAATRIGRAVDVVIVGPVLAPFGSCYAPMDKGLPTRDVSRLRMAGAMRASGVYLAFIDSDDWHDPDAFAAELEVACETGADAVYHSECARFALHGRRVRRYRAPNLVGALWKRLLVLGVDWPPPTKSEHKVWDNDSALLARLQAAAASKHVLEGLRAVHLSGADNASQRGNGAWTSGAEYATPDNLPQGAFLHAVRMQNAFDAWKGSR